MPTPRKIAMVKKLEDTINEYKSFIITDYRGLSVEQLTNLRKKLLEKGVLYQVVKNNLIKIAVQSKKIEGLDEYFCGPTAIAFAKEDPLETSKILAKFAKESKILKLKGAYSEGAVLARDDVIKLSKLPSKEFLIASLLGAMQSPVSKFAGIFSSMQRKLVYTLSQISNKKTD